MRVVRFLAPLCIAVSASLSRLPAGEATVLDPVDFAWISSERLVVANRSGSFSIVAGEPLEVLDEIPMPGRVTAVASGRDDTFWIAEFDRSRVSQWQATGQTVQQTSVITVPDWPSRLAMNGSRTVLVVGSLWSRRISLVDVAGGQRRWTTKLPFAPGDLLWISDAEVLVADAFSGNLCVVTSRDGTIQSTLRTPWHNLRGLRLSPDRQAVSLVHQHLKPGGRTTAESLLAGELIRNELSLVNLDSVRQGRLGDVRTISLGSASRGAADPADAVRLPNGSWLIALHGTSEILHLDANGTERTRWSVGAGPVEMLTGPKGYLVLSRFSQSVARIHPNAGVTETLSLRSPPELSPHRRGEQLFYNAAPSLNSWMTCHSCHPQGHTPGRLADTHGDETFGTPKLIPSLLDTRDANPWGWNGRFRELHEQVRQSVTSSMQGSATERDVRHLVAFLHTLAPPPPVEPSDDDLSSGRKVFHDAGCADCHVPPLTYTSDSVFDVGFEDEAGLKEFNPPSLRGLSQRNRFLHDGRARTVREVLLDAQHQWDASRPEEELHQLLDFLMSL